MDEASGALKQLAGEIHASLAGVAFDNGRFVRDAAIDRLVISDSVPPFRLAGAAAMGKLTVLPSAPLIAASIRRLHDNLGLTDLMAV